MIINKNTKTISQGLAMGILATSIMPTIATNETVEASSKSIIVTANRVNIRSGSSTKYSIVGKVNKGMKLEYISTCSNGWYKIKYDGNVGYITNKYTKISDSTNTIDSIKKVGKVTVSAINVRSGASTKYNIKNTIKRNSVVGVISSNKNGWSKVKLSSSTTGYVYTQYLNIYPGDSSDIKVNYKSTSDSSKPTTNSKLDTVISTVKAQVGKPYVYGAAGPNSFDCSGLTYYSYKKAGIYLNRTSRDQSKNGKYVSKSDLKPGDLVFFNSGTNSIKHVGMYVGNGKFIHSPSPGKGVRYENMSTPYYVKGYVTARRIIY